MKKIIAGIKKELAIANTYAGNYAHQAAQYEDAAANATEAANRWDAIGGQLEVALDVLTNEGAE